MNRQPLRSWRILAIDDDPLILASYREILFNSSVQQFQQTLALLERTATPTTEHQYTLTTAKSGQAGYEAVITALDEKNPFSLIYLDMRMPNGWDGLKTAQKIRAIDPDVRIILISAYSDYQLSEIRQQIGVDFEFLSKPVDHQELLQLTELYIQQWEQHQAWHHHRRELESQVEVRTTELNQSNQRLKQAMDALNREKSELELILESMREGVVAIDRSGNIKHVNQAIERLTGFDEAALAGQPVNRLFTQVEHEQGLEQQTLERVRGHLQQASHQDPESTHRWLHSSLLPAMLVDQHGTIVDANLACQEISGHTPDALINHSIELLIPEPLRESHAIHFANALKDLVSRRMAGERQVPLLKKDGITITTEIGLLPLELSEGIQFMVLLHNPEQEQLWELFRITPFGKLFLSEETPSIDWQLLHKDGSSIPVYVTGAPLYQEEDTLSPFNGAVLVLHDLRERISAEKERRANQAKDRFIASTSHELRTPLTTIIGNSEILAAEGELNENQQGLLRSVDIAGRGLLSLINDILDLSKIESGKFRIDKSDYDLNLLLHEIRHIFSNRAKDAGLCFQINQTLQLEHQLIGDSRRIGQILINLLGNALKFTHQGLITLTVGTKQEQRQLYFRVEDSGIGMSTETIDRLFQPFEQADQTISQRYGGTGLGLHISWTLASLMEGTIRVESVEGEGSLFELTLPFHPSETPAILQEDPPSQQPRRYFRGKVLIAEDTPELQLLECRMLQSMGIEVTVAKHGKEALEQALAEPPDLILMDMEMPVMDGLEATRVLRQVGCETPIVALTANVMPHHRSQFNDAGCDDFLTKPIDQPALHTVLEKHLTELDEKPETTELTFASDESEMIVDDELRQLFIDRTTIHKNHLLEAYAQMDWTQIRNIAHKMKGTGSSFGHPEMTARGGELCQAIDQEEIEHAKSLVESMIRDMDRAVCSSKQAQQ